MRHLRERFKKRRETGRRRGKASKLAQENKRLKAAMEYGPVRSIESRTIFYILTFNPLSKTEHFIEIKHEIDNGNDRYNVYLDGERWRNSWSRHRFSNWVFEQIYKVTVH